MIALTCCRVVVLIGAAFLTFACPLDVRAQTTTLYIHTDALGSPVATTDSSGHVVEEAIYEPYGYAVTQGTQDGPGFTGHVADQQTELTYMQDRYYDPGLGLFLSTDPVTASSSPVMHFNRYRYANNNPYLNTDPSGRAACPKGAGLTCIDSPNTETGDEAQDGPSTEQQLIDATVKTAARSGSLSDGTRLNLRGPEQAYAATTTETRTVSIDPICQRCSNGSTREGGTIRVSDIAKNESGGHTHHANLNGLPGPEDGQMARATGRTAYVISPRGVFGIDKTDVGYRIRLIDGSRPTSKERGDMRILINSWNQHKGGSGVSCTTTSGGC